MKKVIIILSIAAALTMVCTLAACNKNDSDNEGSSAASVVSEQPADPLAGKWQSKDLPDYIYTFNADGTGQYDMAGKVLELGYETTEEGTITISFHEEGYTPVTLRYELDGDTLNIKDSFGSDTIYLRVKG